MPAAEAHEGHMLAQWAYNELVNIETGHRVMLEPLLPRPEFDYTELDMKIADVIAQGFTEKNRIQKIIDDLIEPPNNVTQMFFEKNSEPLFFYDKPESEMIDLQDLTLDIVSVNHCIIDSPIDIIEFNDIGAPIQSIANNLPVNLIGHQGNDN